MVQKTPTHAAPVRSAPAPAFSLVLALILTVGLATSMPAVAASHDGAGKEASPVVTTLQRLSNQLRDFVTGLPDWIDGSWDRLGGGVDPDGAPAPTGGQSSFVGTTWEPAQPVGGKPIER